MPRDKKEKFRQLAEKRVNNSLHCIRLVGNLSNTNNYEYTRDDVAKIFKILKDELQIAEAKFKVKEEKKSFKF